MKGKGDCAWTGPKCNQVYSLLHTSSQQETMFSFRETGLHSRKCLQMNEIFIVLERMFSYLTASLYVVHQPLRWHCFKPAQPLPYYTHEALSQFTHGWGEQIPHAPCFIQVPARCFIDSDIPIVYLEGRRGSGKGCSVWQQTFCSLSRDLSDRAVRP